jgi:Na+-translocating ferredoxin:NAD+ oxidoreductase RNF subunit RnfB
LNGLDDTETWRDVGLLVSPRAAQPFTQTITSACHHCADPACLNGCPVLAYEKDPLTGIVRHLDDQCIGCSYCVLKCPYDVPKYSARLGIVRKCDLCHGRLAAGEAPACAQACPTHAIKVVTVPRPIVSDPRPAPPEFLPGAPDPAYTLPTTRYVTRRTLPAELVAADHATLRPQPAHWPLVFMLTLLPLALGLGGAAVATTGAAQDGATFPLRLASWLATVAGLAAAGFHLGQPLRAWRMFLGWRRSWLSREALVFGAWLATATAAFVMPALQGPGLLLGAIGLGCSGMIYVDTQRRFWRASQTFPRLAGTAVIGGAAVVAPWLAGCLLGLKMAWESRTFFDGSVAARRQRGPLARFAAARDVLGVTAVVLLFTHPGWISLAVLAMGELAERVLFFRAVDAPKMPGNPG